ncbi:MULTISPECIES: hypothetical protein [unclassified Brevundimonas]|uniref:hypothetical protein n=1 Tax=unclassified Brevundimonas TaxID=2622653 RepID=UPI003F92C63A
MFLTRSAVAAMMIALVAGAGTARAGDAEIHTFHCLHGCPMGASATNDLIVREIYTLSTNDRTKFADWVSAGMLFQAFSPHC